MSQLREQLFNFFENEQRRLDGALESLARAVSRARSPRLSWRSERPSPAARAWMDGAELVQRFGGATIDGRYASGKAFTERYESRRPSDLYGAQPDVGRPLVGYRGHAVHDLRWRCVRGLLSRRPRGAELLRILLRVADRRRSARTARRNSALDGAGCRARPIERLQGRTQRLSLRSATLSSQRLQFRFDGAAHLTRSDLLHAGLHDVAGAQALVEDARDGLVDEIGFLRPIEGIA